jgi:acid phosphatase type 7
MKPKSNMKTALLSFCICFTFLQANSQTTIIPYGSSWKYLDNNTRPAGWETSAYNDAAWASGNAELGYGDGDEATTVSFGGNASNKYITTYFRKTVSISNPSSYASFTMNVERDDAFVVYVNGIEVGRDNMPAGTVSHSTLATAAVEDAITTITIAASAFVNGNNVIAVEIHQANATSSDISFNLQLTAIPPGLVNLTRGPYLQMGNQTAITLRWRSNNPSDSRVEVGTTYGSYPIVVDDPVSTTEHEVRVTGLSPDAKYYYRVGSTTQVLQGGTDNFFRTVPPENTARKFRFAVFGDCGRNDLSYRSLSIMHYQNYLTANSIDAADAWILLGDNAYTNGTDAEYTSGFFTPFESNLLKNHKLYPAPGNHDYYSSSQSVRTGAYYQNFTMPTAAECGGVASGTEAFYSFDIGNVHFLSLDSYGTEAGATRLYDTTGPQVTWIKNDLAANTKKWVVAYFHHPPYTMGSHNSDTESELINIRNNFIRILERYGVDLVLCGHSHDYERSYLLDGHYGNESTFSAGTHAKSNSSARYNGTANSCPYRTTYGGSNHGTVYVVAGSSGADGGVQAGYPHNAFPFSQDDGGMFYFEVEDNRLDAKFIRRDGNIADQFTIMQDVNKTTNVNVVTGNSVTLTASWIGTYNWSTGATTRSITVTPSVAGNTSYTVTDNSTGTCITDVFNITAAGILPVQLKDFTATLKGDKVHLNWSTLSETGNKSFTVERSGNASDYQPLTVIAGSDNSSILKKYSYVDEHPVYKENYYRLKQTDRDDRYSYSPVRKIYYAFYPFEIKRISAANGNLNIEIMCGKEDAVQMQVFDLSGRKVTERRVNVIAGTSTISANIENGTYIVQLMNSQGRKVIGRVLVN